MGSGMGRHGVEPATGIDEGRERGEVSENEKSARTKTARRGRDERGVGDRGVCKRGKDGRRGWVGEDEARTRTRRGWQGRGGDGSNEGGEGGEDEDGGENADQRRVTARVTRRGVRPKWAKRRRRGIGTRSAVCASRIPFPFFALAALQLRGHRGSAETAQGDGGSRYCLRRLLILSFFVPFSSTNVLH